MARLSAQEKRDLRELAACASRREEFRLLRERAELVLTADGLIEFLNWSQAYMTEDVSKRGPIKGAKWLL